MTSAAQDVRKAGEEGGRRGRRGGLQRRKRWEAEGETGRTRTEETVGGEEDAGGGGGVKHL
eukprot:630053-Hanusia_phi.AAC.1